MKEMFVEPEVELIELTEDVITDSTCDPEMPDTCLSGDND